MKQFQQDLLESVRQMRRGEAARVTHVQLPAAAQIIRHESDIASLAFDGRTLVVVVAQGSSSVNGANGLKVTFHDVSAFRYLDEADLARYWTSEGFQRGHHLMEVESGGWRDEQSQLQGHELRQREWLVATGNGCVSVFSSEPPGLADIELDGNGNALR